MSVWDGPEVRQSMATARDTEVTSTDVPPNGKDAVRRVSSTEDCEIQGTDVLPEGARAQLGER